MTWRYDGSFEGFLSAVVRTYREKRLPDHLTKTLPKETLFESLLTIPTDYEDAAKLLQAIKNTLGKKAYERIVHTFLCDDQEIENDLLRYIRLGFKEPSILENLSHPTIYSVEGYQRRVLSTLHTMNAYVRFRSLEDGTLYAPFHPPRNVLPLMGGHFTKRFSDEKFILHDVKRAMALTYDGKNISLHHVHAFETPKTSEDELRFSALWKNFFTNVSLKSRQNLQAQQRHVPLLYRQWMCEFDEST